MRRRGYAFATPAVHSPGDDGAGAESRDVGVFFVCYQRQIETFVRTQLSLDESDDLMAFVTPTARRPGVQPWANMDDIPDVTGSRGRNAALEQLLSSSARRASSPDSTTD
jgi:Dyp-type peroxidase family